MPGLSASAHTHTLLHYFNTQNQKLPRMNRPISFLSRFKIKWTGWTDRSLKPTTNRKNRLSRVNQHWTEWTDTESTEPILCFITSVGSMLLYSRFMVDYVGSFCSHGSTSVRMIVRFTRFIFFEPRRGEILQFIPGSFWFSV